MTYEEANAAIAPGLYRHFKGNCYRVLSIARHSETAEPMVVYQALYGDGGIWVRPADMWNETVERDGKTIRRFQPLGRTERVAQSMGIEQTDDASADICKTKEEKDAIHLNTKGY